MAFNTARPNAEELSQIAALRVELAPELAAVPDSHAEQKDGWKLLRFLRGHGAKGAATAYRAMRRHREEARLETARADMLAAAAASFSAAAPGVLAAAHALPLASSSDTVRLP